ncbi:MAG: helix-turn-helix transcriptional regulator [Clostridia bacterium]|nr:helix-turn-helix transcriptional regulator [Clostridia bacterium]
MKSLSRVTVTSIDQIMTVSSLQGRHVRIKNRKYYGLSFCKSGKIDYTQGEKHAISTPDTAVFLPFGGTYELLGTETGEFPLINFSTNEPFCDAPTAIHLKHPESYLRDFFRMEELWCQPESHARLMSVMYDLLHRLSMEETSVSPLLSPAMRYLHEHLADPNLTNSILAAEAKISEVYFRRLFAEAYGVTPRQYILDLRIREACRLLAGNNVTVTSVAEACGFSCVYHFSRAFRNVTGLTPTEYAKSTEQY